MTTAILTAVLLFAVVARVTRLLTTDQLFEPARQWVIEHCGVEHWFTYLVHCQWCLSVWVGTAAAGVAVWLAPFPEVNPAVQVVGMAALYSYLTGALGERFGAQVGGEA